MPQRYFFWEFDARLVKHSAYGNYLMRNRLPWELALAVSECSIQRLPPWREHS